MVAARVKPRWSRQLPLDASGPTHPPERDVLSARRSGATVAKIVAWLYLTEGTAGLYLSSAIAKEARNRLDALRIADERGWP
jgi:DNA-binding NarL/FixJ family response regulator